MCSAGKENTATDFLSHFLVKFEDLDIDLSWENEINNIAYLAIRALRIEEIEIVSTHFPFKETN